MRVGTAIGEAFTYGQRSGPFLVSGLQHRDGPVSAGASREKLMKKFALLSIHTSALAALVFSIGCGGATEGANAIGGIACDESAVEASFGDSCAAGLADVFTCWNPDGDCEVSNFTTTFANGASLISSLDQTLEFRSPSGELCGTATSAVGTGAVQETTFLTRSNETYKYEIDTGTLDVTVVCPGGERVVVDTEQAQAVQSCGGAGQISICENVSVGDPPDPGDLGNIGNDCTNDSECPGTLGLEFVCCAAAGACLPKLSCDLL